MTCISSPLSMLYATTTSYVPTTITTSIPIIVIPDATTSFWTTTSCLSTQSAGLAELVAISGEASTSILIPTSTAASVSLSSGSTRTVTTATAITASTFRADTGRTSAASESSTSVDVTSTNLKEQDLVAVQSSSTNEARPSVSSTTVLSVTTAPHLNSSSSTTTSLYRTAWTTPTETCNSRSSSESSPPTSGGRTSISADTTTLQVPTTTNSQSTTTLHTLATSASTVSNHKSSLTPTSHLSEAKDHITATDGRTTTTTFGDSSTVIPTVVGSSYSARNTISQDPTASSTKTASKHRRALRTPHRRASEDAFATSTGGDGSCDLYTTITSSTVLEGTPATSWSITTVTSSWPSVYSFPTQTIWGCQTTSGTVSSSNSLSTSQVRETTISTSTTSTITSRASIDQLVQTTTTKAKIVSVSSTTNSQSAVKTFSFSSMSAQAASASVSSVKVNLITTTTSSSSVTSLPPTLSFESTASNAALTATSEQCSATSSSSISSATIAAQEAGTTHIDVSSSFSPISTTSSTSGSDTNADDGSSSHLSKAASTGAAIAGVIGLILLLWAALFGLRWYKRRKRVKQTNALRSSWFYGGDIPESEDSESEKRNTHPPQSRFSAPSLLSRTSSAVPTFLSRPLSSIQRQSSRFPPIMSLRTFRESILAPKAIPSSETMGYIKLADRKREEQGIPPLPTPPWAITHSSMAGVGVGESRRISPPKPLPTPENTSSNGDSESSVLILGASPFNHGSSSSSTKQNSPYPLTATRCHTTSMSRDALREESPARDPGTGNHTIKPLSIPLPGPRLGLLMPSVIVTAPTDASGSTYSRSSMGGGLSRTGTVITTWSRASAPAPRSIEPDAGLAGSRVEREIEPDSFPLPPLTFPTGPGEMSPMVASGLLSSPNYSRRDLHDSVRATRSTGNESGVWEYAYADSALGVGRESAGEARTPFGGGEASGGGSGSERSTKNWYEKPLWDQAIPHTSHSVAETVADPQSVYGVSVYSSYSLGGVTSTLGPVPERPRVSRKSVRWEDGSQGPQVL